MRDGTRQQRTVRESARPKVAQKAAPDGSIAASARLFRQKYPQTQYHFVEFITEHLADCSRTFGGDLQQVVILAIIGQVFLRARIDEARRPGQSGAARSTIISASRIADATAIPRETVRRKLVLLERRGWIERAGKGWQITMVDSRATARRDLDALDSRGLERLARLYVGLRALV